MPALTYTLGQLISQIRVATGKLNTEFTRAMIIDAIYAAMINTLKNLDENSAPEMTVEYETTVESNENTDSGEYIPIDFSDVKQLPADILKILSLRFEEISSPIGNKILNYRVIPVSQEQDFFALREVPQKRNDAYWFRRGNVLWLYGGRDFVDKYLGHTAPLRVLALRMPKKPSNNDDLIDFPERYIPGIIPQVLQILGASRAIQTEPTEG